MYFLLLAFIPLVACTETEDLEKAKDHLSQFGYYNPNSFHASELDLQDAIKEYQKFHHLKVTGEMNNETKEEMARPRCGLPDKSAKSDTNAFYKLWRYKWGHRDITYAFQNYGQDLNREVVRATMRKAFNMWAAVTPLTFREVSGRGNINIGFYVGNHGFRDSFPRQTGGVLAHAFFPRDGRLHFDEYEHWSVNCNRGTDLLEVGVHEIGHALGLEHSNVRGAIMWPSYHSCKRNLRLSSDDVRGIQALYGRGSGTGTNTGTGTGGGSCVQTNRWCDTWRREGHCKNPKYKDTLRKECPKSCGYC